MLTVLGIAAIALAIVVRLRWKWTPNILLVLAILLALHLLVADAVPELRPKLALAAVLIGGMYLMVLVGLMLRSLGEK